MDNWCANEPFWDWNQTWHSSDRPDFTACFQRSALIWLPCAFLWVFLPFELHNIRNSRYRNLPITWNRLNTSKLAINCGLIFLNVCDLLSFTFFADPVFIFVVDYISAFVKIATFTLSASLLYLNKKKGLCTSGLLFLFWFLFAVLGLVQLWDELYEQIYAYGHYSFLIHYLGLFMMFVLNIYADRPPLNKNESLTSIYDEKKKQWPEEKVSFLSQLFFKWFDPIIWTGFRRPLELNDFWNIKSRDRAENVVLEFEKYWKKSLKKAEIPYSSGNKNVYFVTRPKPISVLPALCKAFGPMFVFASFLKVFYDILQFVGPMILKAMINFIEAKEPSWKGYVYSCAILISTTTQTLILSQYFYRTSIVGIQIRTALSASIYRKALRMSNGARKTTTLGEIVNLMSVDAQRFQDFTQYLNLIWSAPLQIILAVYFLWQELGPSVLAGLAVMIILIPLNGFIANKTKTFQIKQMKNKDERVKEMNEILNGIKVLKLYGWESSFEAKVMDIRNKEIRVLKKIAYLNSGMSFIWSCAPFIVSLVSFATYIYLNPESTFDADKAFVSLSLFNILRFPISMLPMMISNLVQTIVSLKRINRFMNNEDLSTDSVIHDSSKEHPLIIENGTFQWSEDDPEPILQDINLEIKKGSLYAIVGSVGSGKSSLIASLMGEMIKKSGYVNSVGSVALVQQQAWIQNATLRDNILFGQKYDPKFYKTVIEACALVSDLEILQSKDQTEIGEKGINLSGGQKQRVSLARAVYNNADIYLLDDPLSAVDSHVGKHIFDKVIGPQGLLKNKTRVLVTHGLTYLPKVDCIVVLSDGRISEIGTYKELIDKKSAFADFLVQYLKEEPVEDNEGIEEIIQKLGIDDNEILQRAHSTSRIRLISDSGDDANSEVERKLRKTPEKELTPVHGQKIIEIEKTEIGKVKWDVYIDYIKSIGLFFTLMTIIFNIIYQGFLVSSNLLLSIWTNDKNATDFESRNNYLGIYGLLGIGQVISIIISSLMLFVGVLNAAHYLHNRLLENVLRSPCSFFDVTPVGRILNRFAKDIDTLDNVLPSTLRGWMSCLFAVIATIAVITFAVPVFIIVIIPISIIYYLIQKLYVATSRQIKRIESISRSPIYSHFGESVSGTQTIRAFNVQNRFIRESDQKIDLNLVCYYPSAVANRWLAVRLEMIGNFIIFFACLFVVFSKDSLSSGIVGLAITYSLQITQTLNWLVRMSSDVETNIVSVERIKEYSETEQEYPWEIQETTPVSTWPTSGTIIFQNYSFRYRTGLDLVLKNLNFTIENEKKVGIVGRTGAGKSSLTLALFRIIEASSGTIFIDGVDISKLGLHTLRSKLTIIPQDPVLFSGTLRMNLDPFNVYSDMQLWKAIENSHLKSFVENLPNGLYHIISEGGDNLSVGQRQLVCLARALLRKTKILVLDEATAAVDLETDDLIQKTIRKEFNDCTVLTIAHRLNTILDSDQVLVLEHGQVVEFDSPNVLLNNRSSKFYEMAKDAGIIN